MDTREAAGRRINGKGRKPVITGGTEEKNGAYHRHVVPVTFP